MCHNTTVMFKYAHFQAISYNIFRAQAMLAVANLHAMQLDRMHWNYW